MGSNVTLFVSGDICVFVSCFVSSGGLSSFACVSFLVFWSDICCNVGLCGVCLYTGAG